MLPFGYVSSIKILTEIDNMDTSKSLQSEGSPFKIIKDNTYIFSNCTFQNFNQSIKDGKFKVSPLFKKGNHNDNSTIDK